MALHLLSQHDNTFMKTIQVSSLPLDAVIKEIAEKFGAESKERFGEHSLKIPENIGKGSIRGVNFDGGLGIIQYDCVLKQDTEIQFIVDKVHPLKFIYVIEGKLYHRFENEKDSHVVHQFQNAIVSSSDKHGHILNFKKDLHICIFSLEINRKKFQQKSSYQKDGMNAKLKKLFQDIDVQTSFYYEGEYSLKMADIFKKIDDFKDSDFLNMIFMESLAYQTLVYQISQFLDDQREEGMRTVLRRSEMEKILEASNYIKNNLAAYKSVPSLTKITGLNPTKLQEGFKHLYGTTVNGYVFEARLNHAKDLLLGTDDSISEIVYKVGLSSKSYFSRIFKEQYGVQPSSFRKKQKNNV